MGINKTFAGILTLGACFTAGLYGVPAVYSGYKHLFPDPEFQSGDFSAIRAQAGSEVVLFTTSTCPYCKKAREMLDARHIKYVDYTIDKSIGAEKLFEQQGGGAVPLIYIGNRKIRGLRESAVLDALSTINHLPPPN
ncbi:MAG: glutaredoxin family protein [Proteobacteria bacterium]|nr:glutaredoxin family protein [Pseudomonadota bacterium]